MEIRARREMITIRQGAVAGLYLGGLMNSEIIKRLLDKGLANDSTDYARALGYQGKRRVIVCDGKVISHRRINWFDFCHNLRMKEQRAARKNK